MLHTSLDAHESSGEMSEGQGGVLRGWSLTKNSERRQCCGAPPLSLTYVMDDSIRHES
jgi:hypothetical protein